MNVKVPAIGLFVLLTVSYVKLKTLNGSFFRPVLILDIPVVIILFIMVLWILLKKQGKRDYKKENYRFNIKAPRPKGRGAALNE